MFFERVDFLSPKITLFYKYKKRHSSPIGGLLTSIMIVICSYFILKFLITLFIHNTPSVIFYRKYEKDLSKYALDSSSIVHLIWLNNNNKSSFNSIINTKAIRVILLADDNNYEADTSNLINYEHWVYDACEKNDFNDYEDLLVNDEYINDNNKNITNAICIRYYYNKTEKKYYSSNTKDFNNSFKYPYLEHGISNTNNTILSTIIEKCTNNSITNVIFGDCENEEFIHKYLSEYNSAYFQILDHQVDLNNYYSPIQSYFMGISSFLLHNNGYEVNNIKLSPLLIRSYQNIVGDDYIEKNTVIVDNTQNTLIHSYNKILLKYLFCIQNYKQIYQREYDDLFDAFSSIGGIVQFFYYVFYIINYFYNDYILILNTQNLFLTEPKNKKISRLMNFRRHTSKYEIKSRNNTIGKNCESSNILQQYYKLFSKDNSNINRANYNDQDLSSIKLSESNNNDRDIHFSFSRKIESDTKVRRSHQLDYQKLIKFRLKEDGKKNNQVRNSMFNPKNTVIISPIHRFVSHKVGNVSNNISNNISNILSSNGDFGNNEAIKFFDTFNNSNNNNNKFLNNGTLIDNRDKKNNNNNMIDNSFAENVKICHYLKNKRNTIKEKEKEKEKINSQKKSKNNGLNKTILDLSQEKYISERLTFRDYLNFRCSIKNKRTDIIIIQKFRRKLLSEEHFFKSHLFIYLLIQKIKIDKSDRSDIKELYSEL